MDSQTPEMFYRQMPPVTRFLATATLIVTTLVSFGFLDPRLITLNWLQIWYKLHVWKLITNIFFVGKFSFSWLIHMYLFISFSSRLENHQTFAGSQNAGAYLYFICIITIVLDVLSLLLAYPQGTDSYSLLCTSLRNDIAVKSKTVLLILISCSACVCLPILAPALNFAILYYWSKKESHIPVSFWGFSLLAWQLPFALFIVDILLGQTIYYDLLGLAAGHTYYFLRDVFETTRNSSILTRPPQFLVSITNQLNFFENPSQTFGYRRETANNRPQPQPHRFPGRGYRLVD